MLLVVLWKIMKDFFCIPYITQKQPFRVFCWKGVLKICSKFKGGHSRRSAISIKLQSNFDYWIFNTCSQESNSFMYMYKVHVHKRLQLLTSIQRCYYCQISYSKSNLIAAETWLKVTEAYVHIKAKVIPLGVSNISLYVYISRNCMDRVCNAYQEYV